MKLYIIFILFFSVIISSCSSNEENWNDAEIDEVSVISSEELEQIINNRNGNILFINVWATWCVPCVEEFPDIVKLYNNYSKNGVDFLSLSADLISEKDTKVIPFLGKNNVKFPVYIIDEANSETIINFLNKDWSGALPATFIYNKNGKQIVFLEGLQTYESFKKAVDKSQNL